MINIELLCRNYGIQIAPDSHKHHRAGWVSIRCPFCSGTDGFHLGYSLSSNFFNCWRCGFHSIPSVIRELVRSQDVKDVLREYRTTQNKLAKKTANRKGQAHKCCLPSRLDSLNRDARRYLESRGFDVAELVSLWNIQCAHPLVGSYTGRIIAPITFNNMLVSYQCRDYTGNTDLRYKACAIENEVIHHKHILYGYDQLPTKDCVIVVEGITDVWKLGYGAVATFGIKYTPSQVRLIAEFKKRVIFFDSIDSQARRQGKKLCNELSMYSGETEYVEVKGLKDAGSLSIEKARKLAKSLFV